MQLQRETIRSAANVSTLNSKSLVNSCRFRLAKKNIGTLVNVQKTVPRELVIVIRLWSASAWLVVYRLIFVHQLHIPHIYCCTQDSICNPHICVAMHHCNTSCYAVVRYDALNRVNCYSDMQWQSLKLWELTACNLVSLTQHRTDSLTFHTLSPIKGNIRQRWDSEQPW